jgi:hypothetical protein
MASAMQQVASSLVSMSHTCTIVGRLRQDPQHPPEPCRKFRPSANADDSNAAAERTAWAAASVRRSESGAMSSQTTATPLALNGAPESRLPSWSIYSAKPQAEMLGPPSRG